MNKLCSNEAFLKLTKCGGTRTAGAPHGAGDRGRSGVSFKKASFEQSVFTPMNKLHSSKASFE